MSKDLIQFSIKYGRKKAVEGEREGERKKKEKVSCDMLDRCKLTQEVFFLFNLSTVTNGSKITPIDLPFHEVCRD